MTEFATETDYGSDGSTLYHILRVLWAELLGAWEFTVKWASFRYIGWLLICIKHAISQGLRFFHQYIGVHVHRHV